MNTVLKKASVLAEVKTALGGSGIDVELIAADVDKAMKDAVRLYNRYRPQIGEFALPVASGSRRVSLADKPNAIGIESIEAVDSTQLTALNPFSYANAPHMTPRELSFGEYVRERSYVEQARAVASVDVQYEFRVEGDEPVVYCQTPDNTLATVRYYWALSEEWVADTGDADGYGDYGLKHVPVTDTGWFVDFITAKCKQTLARVLGKFGGIAMPDGGQAPTDSESLRSEGREEEEKLRTAIQKRRRRGTIAWA